MALPEGRKGEGGAVKRVGLHAVRSTDEERFFPVYQNEDGELFIEIRTPTDEVTGAVTMIDSFHHEIHEGETFIVAYKSPDATPLADDATIILHLTPGTSFAHLVFAGECGGDAQLEFYEDPNITGGTAMSERNMKRTDTEPGDVAVVRDPTINAAGTLLFDAFLPGGIGGAAAGGMLGMRDNSEWNLDPDKTYMVRLTNRAGNAQPASLLVQWYEESDN